MVFLFNFEDIFIAEEPLIVFEFLFYNYSNILPY